MGILIQKGNGELLAFIKSCLSGVQNINDAFNSYVQAKKYNVAHNGQIIYLNKCLNDNFDPINRGIYVLTNSGDISPRVYNANELTGDFYYDKDEVEGEFLQNKDESISSFDFTVFIPSTVGFDSVILSTKVNGYKLAEKSFNITIV